MFIPCKFLFNSQNRCPKTGTTTIKTDKNNEYYDGEILIF